ncbi:MAG: hypothetical protein JST40_05095 [Armatimonadetes bacterium]|nr:hypothetical protein [Armatimonadota bacterium]
MKALIFLNVRLFINGVKRAFSSGRRIIGLLFFVGYYVMFFLRPMNQSSRPGTKVSGELLSKLPKPDIGLLVGLIFAAFVLLSLFSAISMLGYGALYRRADVDVVFPSPIDRRITLVFRFIRDSLFTILFPLLMALLFFRPITSGFTKWTDALEPGAGSSITRLGLMAYCLHALVWTSWSYAASLYFNRTGERYEKARTIFYWGVFAAFAATVVSVGYLMFLTPTLQMWRTITESWLLRIPFFPATLASQVVSAGIHGNYFLVMAWVSAMLAVAALGMILALRQVEWSYDIAAQKTSATQETVELQRKGDMYGMLAMQARMGKIKSKKPIWLMRYNWSREWALVWKELILFWRTSKSLLLIALVIAGMFLFLNFKVRSERASIYLAMTAQVTTVFMSMIFLQSAFYELLRRGDLQKPFPFRPGKAIFFEIVGKTLPSAVSALLVAAMFAVTDISQAIANLAIAISLIGGIFCLSSATCLITLLFPDIDDPTQRGFRGLMGLLAMALCLGPGIASGVGIFYLTKNVTLGSLTALVIFVLVGAVCSSVSGQLYSNFNPSE